MKDTVTYVQPGFSSTATLQLCMCICVHYTKDYS